MSARTVSGSRVLFAGHQIPACQRQCDIHWLHPANLPVRWVSSFAIHAIVLRNLLFDARSWHVGTLGRSCVHAKLVLFRSLENPPDGCCKALGAVEEAKPSEREMLCCSCKSSVKSEHSKSCQSQVHPRLIHRRFCLSDLQEEQRRTARKLSWSFPSGALFLCLVQKFGQVKRIHINLIALEISALHAWMHTCLGLSRWWRCFFLAIALWPGGLRDLEADACHWPSSRLVAWVERDSWSRPCHRQADFGTITASATDGVGCSPS